VTSTTATRGWLRSRDGLRRVLRGGKLSVYDYCELPGDSGSRQCPLFNAHCSTLAARDE
jgi:hypothetical protein